MTPVPSLDRAAQDVGSPKVISAAGRRRRGKAWRSQTLGVGDGDPPPVEFPTVGLPSASTCQVNDTELVERARAGDANAFGELVERYQAAVYQVARAALHSQTEADDVTQDAFVAAFRNLGEFRGDASFKTWLLAIAWNTARMQRRSAWRWLGRFRQSSRADTPRGPMPLPSQEVALIRRDLQARVRLTILSLSPKYRDVLLLAASGSLSTEEMAAILGIPGGTVKWRLSEGRKQLRAKLTRLGIRDE